MSADLLEAARVRAMFAQLIGNLATAGVAAPVIGTGALLALIEFMMLNQGVEPTAVWLHNHGRAVDETGDDWLAALNLDGRRNDG